jgi:23S rRNA (cytosine1962-C5)-methyltransferase
VLAKPARHAVVIARAAAEEVRRGHPWVWRSAVKKGLDRVRAGDVVRLESAEGGALGEGIADPDSPIAVRVWVTDGSAIGGPLLDARLRSALALRARMFPDGTTTAYRVIHGEGDRMPGFVVDRYGAVAVLRLDGAGAEAFAEVLVPHLWSALAQTA